MATLSNHPRRGLEKLGWFFAHHQHQEWDRFSPATQNRLVEEDLNAGRNVVLTLLTACVAGGTLLVLVTAYIAMTIQ